MTRSLALVLTIAFLSCPATVMDPVIVGDLAAMQPRVAGFLDEMQQKAGTTDSAYELHTGFYVDVRKDLASLRSRADAADVRAISLIDQVAANIDSLEKVHRQGFAGPEIAVLRQIFNSQFEAIRIAGKER